MLDSRNNKTDDYYLPRSGDYVVKQCERYKDTAVNEKEMTEKLTGKKKPKQNGYFL